MDEDRHNEERQLRRSKRLEDQLRKGEPSFSDHLLTRKRKISSSPEKSSSKYKLRRYLSPRSKSSTKQGSSTGISLGNIKSSLSSSSSHHHHHHHHHHPVSSPLHTATPSNTNTATTTTTSSSSTSSSSALTAISLPSSSKRKHPADAGISNAMSSSQEPRNSLDIDEGNVIPNSSVDDDVTRLQNLLEARGVPPHLLTSFGSRMHLILNRSSSTINQAQNLLQQLQSKSEQEQLDACVDLCQMLVMGNEETLAGFPIRQSVPLLVQLLSVEHNMLLMHHACRALTYLMESLPRSTVFVSEAVPSLLLKLRSIQCMDVAEQSLTALEMLSKKHARNILQAGGVSACLCYLDFFSINAQRSALVVTANCCQIVTPSDSHLVMDCVSPLTAKLNTQDKKILESCCLAFSRLVEQWKSTPSLLMEICKDGLITNLQQLLLVGSPTVMTNNVFITILKILSTVFHYCTSLATDFIKQDASGTIRSLLLGNKAPVSLTTTTPPSTLLHRSSNEMYEILGLCSELLPELPKYGVFSVDNIISGCEDDKNKQWYYKDNASGEWQQFSKPDNKIINASCDAGDTDVSIRISGNSVIVDLSTMKMEYEETGEECDIASTRKKNFLPDILTSNKDKEKEDHRLTLLKEEPMLYHELCQTMLILLFEVYRNSAVPSVRYKCLHCLLRIVYHSKPDILKDSAESLPLSSTVAGMLSSNDSRLTIYGLQLSEILMKKLPSVFAVNFRREGVMYAVKKILAETSCIPSKSDPMPLSPPTCSSSVGSSKLRSLVGSPPRSVPVFPPLSSSDQRTTRSRFKESVSTTSASSDTARDSSPTLPKRLEVWRRRKKPPPLKKKIGKNKYNSSLSPPALPSPGPPSKEDLRQWVRHQADKFYQKYLYDDNAETVTATSILDVLSNAVSTLASCQSTFKTEGPLKQIKSLLVEGGDSNPASMSSFELLHAGLVDTLLKFLTPQPSDRETEVLQRVIKLLEVFVFDDNNEFNPAPYVLLFEKLQQCLGHIEQFPVKVNDGLGESLSKVMSTYQIKCLPKKHPDTSTSSVRQWSSGTVKVDPLAYVQTLEKYLISRGYCKEEGDDDSSDGSDDDGEERVIRRHQSILQKHKLTLFINNHPLPYDMTMYQAIKRYGTHTRLDDEAHPATHTAVWHNIHTIVYKANDGEVRQRLSAIKSDPYLDQTPSSFLEKLSSTPPIILESYQGMKVIQLLHILHTISQEWSLILKTENYNSPILQKDNLVNQQIAAKVERQLQDPLVIMTSEYPKWFVPLPHYTPFLFPFAIRQQLLHATAFDRDRALQRLHEAHPDITINTEARPGIRLEKDKRCVDRGTVFVQGQCIMNELSASKSLLEVYYVGEVGTGLGPTLEFYTLLSHAFQETQYKLWRGDTIEVSINDHRKSYVNPQYGLYPRVMNQTDSVELATVCDIFNYLGRVIGKSLIDNRILDLPLSEPFHRWLIGTHEKMGLVTLKEIDPTLHSSLKEIEAFALKKEKILNDDSLTEDEKSNRLDKITDDDGNNIDDLCLDFLLPGTDIEIIQGGRNTPLTIHNVEDYLCGVVDLTLREGVRKQMEAVRAGFSVVMPLSNLQLFYAHEMNDLLCGSKKEEKWDEDTLVTNIQPDHGYNASSITVKYLIQVMSSFTASEQRGFLKFVTGSPRLPVGGFKSLHPRLTVVKKSVDGNPDDYLPSVMTCVNYLKLPDYSTAAILRGKLLTAIREGQNSFHLS